MARRTRKLKQLDLQYRQWGGRRAGAGRKPKGERAGVPHRRRPAIQNRHPVHVTIKVATDLPNLRRRDLRAVCFAVLEEAAERHGMRIVHFSIQSNHVHLIVECKGTTALQRGMKGLLVRLARRLNKHLGRRGQVFPDRYHVEPLKTPTQVRHALRYVLNNARKHAGPGKKIDARWVDPCSTASAFDGWKSTPNGPAKRDRGDCAPRMPKPGTWLLRVGWRKRGRIPIDDIPGPRR